MKYTLKKAPLADASGAFQLGVSEVLFAHHTLGEHAVGGLHAHRVHPGS
jgi:hypothetical protein